MMNKKITSHAIYLLLLSTLTALLAACGSEAASEPVSVLPEPAAIEESVEVTQPVEYGASLDEWTEATQGEDAPQAHVTAVSLDTSLIVPTLVVTDEPTVDAMAMSLAEGEYRLIMWDALVPADFTANSIMDKYSEQLAVLEDGSPEANELFEKMQAEFDNAPVNEEINGENVQLPGFIAPLEYENDLITEFLLVPYFGACVHVPAPPVNQTVLVRTAEGQGIRPEDSYAPIWIKGVMATEANSTELAQSGYVMVDALIEPYDTP